MPSIGSKEIGFEKAGENKKLKAKIFSTDALIQNWYRYSIAIPMQLKWNSIATAMAKLYFIVDPYIF